MSWYYYDDRFDLMDPPKALSRPSFTWTTLVYYPVPFETKWQDRSPLGVGKVPS